MKSLIVRCLCVIILVITVCTISAHFIMPPMDVTMDVALGQLENSDANFAALQHYNTMRNIGYAIDSLAVAFGIGYIYSAIRKYFN